MISLTSACNNEEASFAGCSKIFHSTWRRKVLHRSGFKFPFLGVQFCRKMITTLIVFRQINVSSYTNLNFYRNSQNGGRRRTEIWTKEMDSLFWECDINYLLSRIIRVRSNFVWVRKWSESSSRLSPCVYMQTNAILPFRIVWKSRKLYLKPSSPTHGSSTHRLSCF